MAFVGAVAFAKIMHGEQRRKGFDAPFIAHPLAVASLVMEYGQFEPDSDTVQAALLHDIVEDTVITAEHLAHEFSPKVAEMVLDLSHVEGVSGREKRLRYIQRMREVDDVRVVLISACDKLDNLRSILHVLRQGVDDSWYHGLWFYADLLDVYIDRGLPDLLLQEYRSTLERVEES